MKQNAKCADVNELSESRNRILPKKSMETKWEAGMIVFVAVLAITICSKSSPLYPLNDWMDANCFITVGKSILHGLVPYRDLYEQKGPLLYAIYALAALVSERSFLGVYFLEIIAAVLYLYFGFRVMKLYQRSASVFLVPVLAALVYSAVNFSHGGSAEEFCLPFFAFALYLLVKWIRNRQIPSQLECIALGITSACVLWIKFSLLGFYLGWFFVMLWQLLREGKGKRLCSMLFFIGVGVMLPTIFILLYFWHHHGLDDLWQVYFYDNIFSYTKTSDQFFLLSLAENLRNGMSNMLSGNVWYLLALVVGGFALRQKKHGMEVISYGLLWFFTFLLIYVGGRRYVYYGLMFAVFMPFEIWGSYRILQKLLFEKWRKKLFLIFLRRAGIIACMGSLLYVLWACPNTYLLSYEKKDLPQYRFAEIISQKENATLLNYGFLDGGFYTTTGIVPNCKFFCKVNMSLKEMTETQNEYVKLGKVDFVVTRDKKLQSDLYECVASQSYYHEGRKRTYYLYQCISLREN